jgi:hypothetical protein
VGVLAIFLANVLAASCVAWNPFASADNDTAVKPTPAATSQEPSVWNKIGLGAKPAEEPKKRTLVCATPVPVQRKAESESWFSKLFKPKEPEKPKTVDQWLKNSKRLDPYHVDADEKK